MAKISWEFNFPCPHCKERWPVNIEIDTANISKEKRALKCTNPKCLRTFNSNDEQLLNWIGERIEKALKKANDKIIPELADTGAGAIPAAERVARPPQNSALDAALSIDRVFAELDRWIDDPDRRGYLQVQLRRLADRIGPDQSSDDHPSTVEKPVPEPAQVADDPEPTRPPTLVETPVEEAKGTGPQPPLATLIKRSDRSVGIKSWPSILASPFRGSTAGKGRDEPGIGADSLLTALRDLDRTRQEFADLGVALAGHLHKPPGPDADAIADRLLDRLADKARVRSLIEDVAVELNQDSWKVVQEIPLLFDAIEDPLKSWRMGSALTEEQRLARDQVVLVLEGIKRKLDAWKLLRKFEEIPGGSEDSPRYDTYWHTRTDSKPSVNDSLWGRVARTDQLGYRWNGKRLRKAEVHVYMAPEAAAEPSTPTGKVDEAPERVAAPSTPTGKIDEAPETAAEPSTPTDKVEQEPEQVAEPSTPTYPPEAPTDPTS
jgi:hypothetical protein